MKDMKKIAISGLALLAMTGMGTAAQAAEYKFDIPGMHASIDFRISHLGFSWMTGRFDRFDGSFTFDEANPENSRVVVEIDPASINTNHGERDNHLRNADFLDVANFPEARYESRSVEVTGDKTAIIRGDLTLRGVTRPVDIQMEYVGGGQDPWGGTRAGFTGTTTLTLADYGMTYNLGPTAEQIYMTFDIEGIRQ